MSGQSIVDRLNAAKHTVAGSALGRAVVKATTEEIMAPKRKHLEYLLQSTSEMNVSIPQMADLLIERTQNSSWVVTFKSLITIHHLMCYGNERFSQYMASHSSKFLLNNFIDKSGIQGVDMSSYIRKYANYLNEKRESYKIMGYDFCKVKTGKDDGMLRTMVTEKLIKTLPILHQQLESLLQFDVQPNELTNSVINSCFILLSKDLIRLFARYNDGVINLLEKYFDMNKKNCKEALDIYKKFLESTDKVSAFLKVAENAGMDKSDIPDLTKAPSSLLEALESHLVSLENKKTTTSTNGTTTAITTTTTNKPPSSVTNAINTLNSNVSLSAEEKRRVIEEEAKTLEAFKANHIRKQGSLSSPTNEYSMPLSSSSTTTNQTKSNISDDLFNIDFTTSNTTQSTFNNAAANNDLFTLNITSNTMNTNPFVQPTNPFSATPIITASAPPLSTTTTTTTTNQLFPNLNNNTNVNSQSPIFMQSNFQNTNANLANYYAYGAYRTNGITSNHHHHVLDVSPPSDFDAFGDVLQPTSANNVLKPKSQQNENKQQQQQQQNEKKILSTDIDSSLASLADNLDINHKNKGFQKNHQWTPDQQQGQLKTGGNDWKPIKTSTISTAPIVTPVTNTMQQGMWNSMPPTGMNMMPSVSVPQQNWNMNVTTINNPFGVVPQPLAQQAMFTIAAQPNLQMRPMQSQVKPATTTTNNPFGF